MGGWVGFWVPTLALFVRMSPMGTRTLWGASSSAMLFWGVLEGMNLVYSERAKQALVSSGWVCWWEALPGGVGVGMGVSQGEEVGRKRPRQPWAARSGGCGCLCEEKNRGVGGLGPFFPSLPSRSMPEAPPLADGPTSGPTQRFPWSNLGHHDQIMTPPTHPPTHNVQPQQQPAAASGGTGSFSFSFVAAPTSVRPITSPSAA